MAAAVRAAHHGDGRGLLLVGRRFDDRVVEDRGAVGGEGDLVPAGRRRRATGMETVTIDAVGDHDRAGDAVGGGQIVSGPVKAFLDFEWLQPDEGEQTAAVRLLRRLPQLYGSSFVDILLLDALYAQTAVLDLAQQIGWDVVISLKQNQPDLYKSAIRLFARRSPDATFTEQRDHKT